MVVCNPIKRCTEWAAVDCAPAPRPAFSADGAYMVTPPAGIASGYSSTGLTPPDVAAEDRADLGQVLFGPSETHQTQLAEARRLLVRTPGEEKIMRLADRALETPPRFQDYGMPEFVGLNALMRFARTVDALTGSRRMESCMTMQPY